MQFQRLGILRSLLIAHLLGWGALPFDVPPMKAGPLEVYEYELRSLSCNL